MQTRCSGEHSGVEGGGRPRSPERWCPGARVGTRLSGPGQARRCRRAGTVRWAGRRGSVPDCRSHGRLGRGRRPGRHKRCSRWHNCRRARAGREIGSGGFGRPGWWRAGSAQRGCRAWRSSVCVRGEGVSGAGAAGVDPVPGPGARSARDWEIRAGRSPADMTVVQHGASDTTRPVALAGERHVESVRVQRHGTAPPRAGGRNRGWARRRRDAGGGYPGQWPAARAGDLRPLLAGRAAVGVGPQTLAGCGEGVSATGASTGSAGSACQPGMSIRPRVINSYGTRE